MTAIQHNKSIPTLVVPGTFLEYLVIKNKKIRNMYLFTSARIYIQLAFLGENSHMEIEIKNPKLLSFHCLSSF